MTKSRAFLPLAFRPAFILIALFLGLLGMHVVGVDHHAPHATHNPPLGVIGQEAILDSAHGPNPFSALTQHAPADDTPASFAGDTVGGVESALIGICVLALSIGGLFFRRVSRACRSIPSWGLPAPPVFWIPRVHAHTTPSLIQLSISRT